MARSSRCWSAVITPPPGPPAACWPASSASRICSIGCAQRYPGPDEFSLDRPRSRDHLGFGWGIHRCVGMPLAQLEIRVAVEEVLARSAWIELRDEITWTSSTEPRDIPVLLR